ncbi:MAG: TrkH family potassium uptake protein [bacterium]|jgi:trk system potassium uptake protein TrkH
MNLYITSRIMGQLLFALAVAELFPLVCAAIYGETRIVIAFVWSIAAAASAGAMLFFIGGLRKEEIFRKEALFIVGAGWVLAGLLGALPFVISGQMHYVDAVFETISGFTTTGASILTDVETVPKGLLFWRSFTHWLGGMGIVVLFIAVLPTLGVGGKHLYHVEAPGPAAEGLRPKIRDTAGILWKIYLGLSIAEVLLLLLTGMPLFDALCHTFGTMATGGFSTKNASIGYYNSVSAAAGVSVTIIVTIFMFLAGANFSLYYQALKKKWLFFKDSEFKAYLGIFLAALFAIYCTLLLSGTHSNGFKAFLDSAFQTSSIMTTTGYATADFNMWPSVARAILILLMFFGGCAGSTGGGMKIVRVIILAKWAWRSIVHSFRPQSVMHIKLGKLAVDRDVEEQTVGFAIVFIAIFSLGTLFIAAFGHDLVTSYSSVIACLGNIGPGLGQVGPMVNYSFFSPIEKIFLTWCMLVGRLEVFPMLVAFAPGFWKK